jgi:hypothetical protein
MEVGQGQNWGCSAKGKKVYTDRKMYTSKNWQKFIQDTYVNGNVMMTPDPDMHST